MFEAPSSWTWWTKQSGGDRIKGMGRADEMASRSIHGREVPAKSPGVLRSFRWNILFKNFEVGSSHATNSLMGVAHQK